MRTCVCRNLGKVAGLSPLRGVNCEQRDSVPQLFESNGWPGNVEVTDTCDTESNGWPGNVEVTDTCDTESNGWPGNVEVTDTCDTESNGWPGNVEVTDTCDTESAALSVSLDKPCPFVIKSSLLQSF